MKTCYNSLEDYEKAIDEYYQHQLPDIHQEFVLAMREDDTLENRLLFYDQYTQELTDLFALKTVCYYKPDPGKKATVGKVYIRGMYYEYNTPRLETLSESLVPLDKVRLDLVCRLRLVSDKGHSYVARGYLCTEEYLLNTVHPIQLTYETPGGHLKKM